MNPNATSPGLRLFLAGVVGMTVVLGLMGGGLWALAPDLLDGAPPKPFAGPVQTPKVAGAGFGAVRVSPPPRPLSPAPTEDEKPKEGETPTAKVSENTSGETAKPNDDGKKGDDKKEDKKEDGKSEDTGKPEQPMSE